MNRKVYIADHTLSLAERIPEIDDLPDYECWQDRATQDGYNFALTTPFDEWRALPVRSRFIAAIQRNADGVCIGQITVSPEGEPPDLAIMLYKPFRQQGYGTIAFSLGIKYCFEVLKIERLYAGCYETNTSSRKMLIKCGFQPNPQGDQLAKHYLTGEPITQFDFVRINPDY